MNPYATHLSMLIKVVEASTGPVLELGAGDSSTPILHRLCSEQGRLLVSMDSDAKYLEQFEHYRGTYHKLVLVENWSQADLFGPWSVVLVDHRPASKRRDSARRVAQSADYVVCHDTEPENDRFYHWYGAFNAFRYRYDDRAQKPYTTVLSNTKELDWLAI